MQSNPIVSASLQLLADRGGLNAALIRAKTRAGRMENKRFIEALVTRDVRACVRTCS
jgi:hypothetical protein